MGIKYKKWVVESNKIPKDKDELINTLLEVRNITTQKEKNEFLNPRKPEELSLIDFGLKEKDLKKLIKKLKEVKEKKEKIYIYGDYDADGITSTAIMWEVLHSIGMDVMPYIPDRGSEGYGINIKSVEKLKKDNPNLTLILTVDNGIVAIDAIDKALEMGVDVAILDHHQKGERYPNAHTIIHTTTSCGAAIAWIVGKYILEEFGKREQIGLELAAIGTIADQMILTHTNRSIAYWGLKEIQKTKRVGLRALLKGAKIDGKEISEFEVNYIIAPRLNAMGRVAHGIDSLRLLCTKDTKRAEELSKLLNDKNYERQKIVEEVITNARVNVDKNKKIIILSSNDYHEGVIGIAAGKLVEEFHCPSIVIAVGEEISKGSARSVSGFNIIEVINEAKDLIIGGGGHPMAAGFSIKKENIKLFEERLLELSKAKLTDDLLSPKLKLEMEIGFNLINKELVNVIKRCAPFGYGNKEPLFFTKNVLVMESKRVGNDRKTYKLVLKERNVFDAIWFGVSSDVEIKKGSNINICYYLDENTYNGITSLQLRIKDVELA